MIRWTLHYSRASVNSIYSRVLRERVKEVTAAIQSLAEYPMPSHAQPSESDPSVYWIAVPGDYIVIYEIIDERYIVRILGIR